MNICGIRNPRSLGTEKKKTTTTTNKNHFPCFSDSDFVLKLLHYYIFLHLFSSWMIPLMYFHIIFSAIACLQSKNEWDLLSTDMISNNRVTSPFYVTENCVRIALSALTLLWDPLLAGGGQSLSQPPNLLFLFLWITIHSHRRKQICIHLFTGYARKLASQQAANLPGQR